jgi:tRNA/rRNA methyltransferase
MSYGVLEDVDDVNDSSLTLVEDQPALSAPRAAASHSTPLQDKVHNSAMVGSEQFDGSQLARVRIVLSDTIHPGNIGSAARALKTMGLTRLSLVNPLRFPDPQATAMAAGAADLLDTVRIFTNLDEALHATTLTVGLSARIRDLSPIVLDAREAARLGVEEAAAGGEVAFVFGNEVSGLSNEELLRCQRVARIGASPAFSSLNLAAAVQVVAYEMHHAALGAPTYPADRTPPATHDELEGFFAHLEASLLQSGFLGPGNPRRLMERLRRLFGRARLESQEVNILRGMLSSWDARPRRRTRRGGKEAD